MVTANSEWGPIFSLIFRPRLLLQGVVEYASGWFFTRSWWWLLFVYSPAVLLLLAAVVVVGYGSMLSRQTLVDRYVNWVSEELPTAMSALEESLAAEESAASEDEQGLSAEEEEDAKAEPQSDPDAQSNGEAASDLETVSAYGELLLRRLLQLNQENSRATYLVASQLYRRGRTGQARQMMRRVAPEGGGGFAPGHAWLAGERLQSNSVGTEEDWQRFEADMETALSWTLTDPQLIAIYANQLADMPVEEADVRRANVDRALAILSRRGQQFPELQIELANLAAKYGRDESLERVSDDAKKQIRQRMENGTATVEDLLDLANLFLLEKNADKAIAVTDMGLKREPDNSGLRRIRSEAYRLKYLESQVRDTGGVQVDIALLDAALRSDPTNPGVSVEIAKLLAAGKSMPPEFKTALQQQLANGKATALTHILLADRQLMDGNIQEAIPHLEAALRQSPNNPQVLNNLGLAVAKTDSAALDRALELSSKAVSLIPNNPDFLDTLAEIRWLQGDKVGALESYEAAIGYKECRISTRLSLAKLYRELGMVEMAETQEALIKNLQEPNG